MIAKLVALIAGATLVLGLLVALNGTAVAAQFRINDEVAPSELALSDIPPVALAAYQAAAAQRCGDLPWTILAAIGKVETDHGRYGGAAVGPTGDVTPPILGVVLDGSTPGTRSIPLPAGGSPWHDHPTHDRALGPMQFLTATFRTVGVDGNGDGTADPHNLIDAVHSAAVYLCSNGTVGDIDAAIKRYNNSSAYVAKVLDWSAKYSSFTPPAGGPASGNIVPVAGISMGLDASVARQVTAMLAAAKADGVTLTGSGWRSPERTAELRVINGCPDVWTSPPSTCDTPTAIPGTSMHEKGLAIDFDRCSSRASACHVWLKANAAQFGFYVLSSEPWHWSTTGG